MASRPIDVKKPPLAPPSVPAEPLVSTLDDPGFSELVDDFISELKSKIETLEQGLRDEQFGEIVTLAHRLKGSAGGYGFGPITDSAARLEKTAREARDLELLESQVNELVDLCRRAAPAKRT